MEMDRQVQTELIMDDRYQALQWDTTQVCPWPEDSKSIEGYDLGSLGLIFAGGYLKF